MRQQELIDNLESLVDVTCLTDVVLALARMCNEKAEHLRSNWQDEKSARTWDKDAKQLDKCSIILNN